MARGGYRPPDDPAAVSGPGRLSRRTDTGPSDPDLGRQVAAGRRGRPGDAMKAFRQQLFAPTERPSEPVTERQPSFVEEDPDELVRAMYANALVRGDAREVGVFLELLAP